MIKIEELAMPTYTSDDIQRIISLGNCAVMNVVEQILNDNFLSFMIEEVLEWFATALYVTYSKEEIIEQLNSVDDSSNMVAQELGENCAYEIAELIGTNSEFREENYSFCDRVILLIGLAKKMDMKFDFSWNL